MESSTREVIDHEEPLIRGSPRTKKLLGFGLGATMLLLIACLVLSILAITHSSKVSGLTDRVDGLEATVNGQINDTSQFNQTLNLHTHQILFLSSVMDELRNITDDLRLSIVSLERKSVVVNKTLLLFHSQVEDLQDITSRQQTVITDMQAFIGNIQTLIQTLNKTISIIPAQIRFLQNITAKHDGKISKLGTETDMLRKDLTETEYESAANFSMVRQTINTVYSELRGDLFGLHRYATPEYGYLYSEPQVLKLTGHSKDSLKYTILDDARFNFSSENGGFAICSYSAYTNSSCQDCEISIAPFLNGIKADFIEPRAFIHRDSHFGYTIMFPFREGAHMLTTGVGLIGDSDDQFEINLPSGFEGFCNFYGVER